MFYEGVDCIGHGEFGLPRDEFVKAPAEEAALSALALFLVRNIGYGFRKAFGQIRGRTKIFCP